jgi:hypothetical protein
VTGVVREQTGWERVYRLQPAANPGSAAHVLVLIAPEGDLARAFPSDSALQAQRLDSLERLRVADSVAQAARDARVRRADSLAAIRRDTTRVPPRRVVRPDTSAAPVRPGAAPPSAAPPSAAPPSPAPAARSPGASPGDTAR